MAQIFFYRYTDDNEARFIRQNGCIKPGPSQLSKWFTPDRYETGTEAQTFLAMAYTPTHRIGPIPELEMPDFDHTSLRIVGAANSQPGGGLEVATTHIYYLFGIAPIPQN